MDIIERIKRTAKKNTLWVDTTGTGDAVADCLESCDIPVNRITGSDRLFLEQHLGRCEQDVRQNKVSSPPS